MPRPRKQGTTEKEEQHLSRIRLASKARQRTYARLRDMYPEDYQRFYEEEAKLVGVLPASVARREKREALLKQLEELDREDGRVARRRKVPATTTIRKARNGR